jgi:hypothetical protein
MVSTEVLAVHAAHYNGRRPHRALRLRPPRPTSPIPEPVDGRIRRRAAQYRHLMAQRQDFGVLGASERASSASQFRTRASIR